MKKIDQIIKFIKEEMVVGNGGFTGSANPEGPVAGSDPVIPGMRRRRDGKLDRRVKRLYKKWLSQD